MSAADTVRTNYCNAHAELIERIRLRDHVLLVYLALVGTVFGVAFGTAIQFEVLLALPFVAFGATILVCQHNCVIGSLQDYFVNELTPALKVETPSEYAVQWDNSNALYKYNSQAIRLRSIGHCVLLLVPCIVALSTNWKHGFFSPFPFSTAWWFGLVCIALIIWFIYQSHKWRKDIYATFDWNCP